MQLKSFILSFVLILSLIPQGVLANTKDTTPPTLESIEMIDTNVNAGDRVSFKVKTKDNLSGVRDIYALFTSQSGKRLIEARLEIEKETEDHVYILTTNTAIDSFAKEETWYIAYLSIKDKAYNMFSQEYGYDSNKVKPVVTFEVKNDSSDTTSPKLESIEMIDTNVNAGDTVSLKVKTKDDLSGLSLIYVEFTSPSRAHIVGANLRIEKETEDHVYILTTDALHTFAEEGTWYISYVQVNDNADNMFSQYYGYDSSNQAKPFITFEVENDSSDIKQPTLESIEMIDTNVSPSNREVSFKVKTKDNLSGVRDIYAIFTSPSGARAVAAYLEIEKETEDHMYTLTTNSIDSFAEEGTWYISLLQLGDKAYNMFSQEYGYDSNKVKPVVTFEVGNDTTPPTLESIEMIDTQVNAGGTVSFKMKAKDDISGLNHIGATFISPSGKQSISADLWIEKETEDHVYTLTTDAIKMVAEEGTWYISSLYLQDKADNHFWQEYGYDSNKVKPVVTFEVGKKVEEIKPIPNEGDFTTWDPKYDVPLNKEWTVDFSLAFDIKTILSNNIYITDSLGKKVPSLFIIDRGADNKSSTLIIAPIDNYVANTTYTLWIKDIYSQDGKKLSKNVKMQFTTK